MRHTSRPKANNKSARIAWDELARDAASKNPPRTIQYIWFAREMEAWVAYLNETGDEKDDPYIEIDMLVVLDMKNNPHKYAANDEGRSNP